MSERNIDLKERIMELLLEAEAVGGARQKSVETLQAVMQDLESDVVKPHLEDEKVSRGPLRAFLVPHADGVHYTLPLPTRLASTRIYDSQWTVLSSETANILCNTFSKVHLLTILNTIFGSSFRLTRGILSFFEELLNDGCDLGTLYGYVRPWWNILPNSRGAGSLSMMIQQHRENDYTLRSSALNSARIVNPYVPPRRVWDLFANRVLPFYAITSDPSGKKLPDNLWAVSHSWVAPTSRKYVLTPINARAWRVPIPRETSLDDIREELLTLGAEYVFLDVLCLRQKDDDHPELEGIRKREWRLDVPTIGHIYGEDANRPVIVYFNGLGLPFRDHPIDPLDTYHWFNRVWTLQESPRCTIIGGLKEPLSKFSVLDEKHWPAAVSPRFLRSLKQAVQNAVGLAKTLTLVLPRAYANPVDQVACIAYLLRCATLPIYDADMDVEVAWSLLIECMPPWVRTQLLFLDFGVREKNGSWWPTWKEIKRGVRFRDPLSNSRRELLVYRHNLSQALGCGKHGFDASFHTAFVIPGCRFTIAESGVEGSVSIPLSRSGECTLDIQEWRGPRLEDKLYLLIGVGDMVYWIVAVVEGIRCILKRRALEVSKLAVIVLPDTRITQRKDTVNFIDNVKGDIRLVAYR